MKPSPISWNTFRKAVRAYYGIPVHPSFMSRVWREHKAGKSGAPILLALGLI